MEFPENQNLINVNTLVPLLKMVNLTWFVDNDGVIRVGGWLQYSNLPFRLKHSILSPKKHHHIILYGTLPRYIILNCRNTK